MAEQDGFFDADKNRNIPLLILFKNARMVFKLDELGLEIAQIALPAAMALAADPIASLVDTAFIGHIGPIELAAVGVSIALFNQVSRIAIFPLVSITTSFVAEEDAKSTLKANEDLELASSSLNNETKELIPQKESNSEIFDIDMPKNQKRHIPSASSALIIGTILGIVQTIFLIFLAKPLLKYMGISSDSPMLPPAQQYLTLRSLGAPAVLLSLAMQGVFRGFKDTKTPLYATVAGDATNIILDPIFIFVFRMGVSGAAIAHVISQYLISAILFWKLLQQIDLLPPYFKDLQFSRFLKNGPTPMAAFQVCLQVWLTTSLLADGLAVAAQAILASAFANSDYEKARSTASRVLQLGFILGLTLAIMLGFGLHFGAKLFTKDDDVLHFISIGIPFVALTQPINALAFVFDGINFGASDFAYSGYSMVTVAIISILCLLVLSLRHGFIGIWFALTIFMSLRALAGFWRIGTGSGPWNFLRS